MNIAIYGTSTSGYYAEELAKLQGNNILLFIDIQGEIIDRRISKNTPVVDSVTSIPNEVLNDVQLILVALGNKEQALNVKRNILNLIDKEVVTIHESPYNSIYDNMINKKSNYLEGIGFYRSVEEGSPVNSEGSPIPWITYPCIDFISSRLHPEMKVFEFGMGNSTIWWSNKVSEVYSIEHNITWYEAIREKINLDNVSLVFNELEYNGEYSKEVIKHKDLDIVVVDGRDRVNCAINSVNSLKKNGIIIWDDTDRISYEKGINFLLEKGFKKLDFVGLSPMSDIKTQTSIFYKNENCLGL